MVIVETRAFTARIGDLLSHEQYRALQMVAFAKNERADLTVEQRNAPRQIVESEYR